MMRMMDMMMMGMMEMMMNDEDADGGRLEYLTQQQIKQPTNATTKNQLLKGISKTTNGPQHIWTAKHQPNHCPKQQNHHHWQEKQNHHQANNIMMTMVMKKMRMMEVMKICFCRQRDKSVQKAVALERKENEKTAKQTRWEGGRK